MTQSRQVLLFENCSPARLRLRCGQRSSVTVPGRAAPKALSPVPSLPCSMLSNFPSSLSLEHIFYRRCVHLNDGCVCVCASRTQWQKRGRAFKRLCHSCRQNFVPLSPQSSDTHEQISVSSSFLPTTVA